MTAGAAVVDGCGLSVGRSIELQAGRMGDGVGVRGVMLVGSLGVERGLSGNTGLVRAENLPGARGSSPRACGPVDGPGAWGRVWRGWREEERRGE